MRILRLIPVRKVSPIVMAHVQMPGGYGLGATPKKSKTVGWGNPSGPHQVGNYLLKLLFARRKTGAASCLRAAGAYS